MKQNNVLAMFFTSQGNEAISIMLYTHIGGVWGWVGVVGVGMGVSCIGGETDLLDAVCPSVSLASVTCA